LAVSLSLAANKCEREVIKMVTDSSFLTQAFMHSGKFFNELGNYDVCSDPQNDYVYALAVIRPDLQAIV